MKLIPAIVFLFGLLLGGCASETPPPPKPLIGVLSIHKIGNQPREVSHFEVKVHYENLLPEEYEIKIGFGYEPPDRSIPGMEGGVNLFWVAHTQLVKQPSGDIVVTIAPEGVQRMGGKLDGKIHAILSAHPHGKEWVVVGHDILYMDPE